MRDRLDDILKSLVRRPCVYVAAGSVAAAAVEFLAVRAAAMLMLPESYSATKPPENAPRSAIVTPHFNQLQFLKATIDSVVSQNYPNLSYCVQDANSGEETRRLLESYGEKLVWRSEPDSGQAQAINRGFRHVSGDMMAYLNSDDLLLPGTLAYVARAFQDHPEIDLVYGHTDIHRGAEAGRSAAPSCPRTIPQMLKWMDYIPQETLFWRKRVWDAIGPMDESFRFALDWDFIVRAIRRRVSVSCGCRAFSPVSACTRRKKALSMIDIGNRGDEPHPRAGPWPTAQTERGGPGRSRLFAPPGAVSSPL